MIWANTVLLLSTISAAFSGPTNSGTIAVSGEQTYANVCYVCHDAGLWGAPMLGDHQAWTARLAQEGSVDALVAVAKRGKGHMPARGGQPDLSDDDLKAAIQYILSQGKVNP